MTTVSHFKVDSNVNCIPTCPQEKHKKWFSEERKRAIFQVKIFPSHLNVHCTFVQWQKKEVTPDIEM